MVPVNNNSTASSAIRVLGELSLGGILMHGTSQQQLNPKFCYKGVRGTVSRGYIDAWYQSTTTLP